MAQTGNTILVTNVMSDGPRLKIWGVLDKTNNAFVENLISMLDKKLIKQQALGLQNYLPEAVCCVKYRGKFVRGKIINFVQNGFIVNLIDKGIIETVPVEVVRLLFPNSKEEDLLMKIPPLAVECTLANVLSISEKWDIRSIETILSLVKDKDLIVSNYEKCNSHNLVKLVFGDHDIGNLLVNKGMAKMSTLIEMFKPSMYSQQQSYKLPPVPHHQQQVPVTQMPNNGYYGDQAFRSSRMNVMTMQQNMEPENVHYNQPGYVYQPSHMQQQTPLQRTMVSPRKPEIHEESQSEIFEFRTRLVQVGTKYSAYVSCVEDGPNKFSVQLEENRELLMDMMQQIQAHTPSPIREPPLPGSVCLARLKKERSLCRAVVMATFETQIKIYFVDFGNTDFVSHTDIYRLPTKFIAPKVLSIRICLTGLKEMNITEEVKTYFQNLIYGKQVELIVCEPEGPFLIQYGEIFIHGRNIKELLKQQFPDIASVTYGHIPALTDGTKEIVYVSHIYSCSKFFVQLEKNVSDLEQMMITIGEYATKAEPLKQIDVNKLCIAPYEVDDQWYRVKILKRDRENVRVLYVDYGNEETVNVNQLRTISRDLVKQMPCQAIQCVLNGFQSRASKPQFDAAFEELTTDKRLSMTVKNAQPTCLIVDLFDFSTSPTKNILLELNKATTDTSSVNDNVSNRKSNEFETTVPQNQRRDDVGVSNVSTPSHVNPFRSNNDETSKNRSKSWKEDHNEQRHDNRFQQRDESDRFNRDSGNDRNGRGSNFNRDGANRSFNRDGGGNNSFSRDEEGSNSFKKDAENNSFSRDGRNERFNNRDGANNSFSRDTGSRDSGNDRFNRGSDRFNRDGGNDRFNRSEGNDRYNRDGGNDRFNRDGGNARFNRDGGNDRFSRDGGNDRFNRDGNDRFNRSGGSDRFNKDGGNNERNNFRDGGRHNPFSQNDNNRDDRNRGNKFSKRDASDNESTSSKGSGKRGEKSGYQGRNDRDNKSNRFNKFGNDDGFKPRNHDDNSGSNFKPKYGRDNVYNEPKEPTNFETRIESSKAKIMEISLPSITLGTKHKCEIVFLTNLSDFYIHLIPENEKIEELMEKIASIYDCGGTVMESSKVKSNVACIAQYAEDFRWYRAIIKSVEGNKANVLFLDYGNLDLISFDKLKEIKEEFTALPVQAVPCKLFGPKKTEWTEEEITTFSDMVNEKLLEVEFIAKDKDVFQVIVREVENEITKPEMINATFCPGVDLMKAKDDVKKTTKVSNESHQKSLPDFASLDSKWVEQEVIPGTKDTVIVTWFDSTDSFYCQSINKQKEFRPMMEEIQKVYGGRKSISDTLQPGYSVIAVFAQDEALYRAEVMEVKNNRNYLVQYVDFGNKATVDQRNIYSVEKKFMSLPKQGIRCSLKNIVPVDGSNWTSSNSQKVEQYLYEEGEFECTYHEEKDKKYLVSLHHNGVDVADSLVKKKQAMFSTSSSAPVSIEKAVEKLSSDIISRLDIQLLPGQTLRVKVSNVEGVSKFHIQFASADYCNQLISSHMTNNDPKVMPRLSSHEMCVGAGCLIFKDGIWRRAVIVNCCEKISFDVKLIDTGAYDKISQDRVLALPGQLSVMQNQAIECSLHNVKPSSSLDEMLKKMILNKDVIIYVEKVDNNRLIVELYDSLGCKIQLNDDSSDMKLSPICPMPILSSTHDVTVSTADHSNSLWLQIMSDSKKDEKLIHEMYEFYSVSREQAVPESNKMCVVQSQGSFCRAKVIKKTDDDKVLVNLIDYGVNENVSCDKLMVLDCRFHEPYQLAIHVSLNVTLRGSPAEQIKVLKPFLLGKVFTATFYNVHKKWIVELVENGVKLSETLSALNLVKELTTHVSEETEEITANEKFKVVVSHADSPAQFWIQKIDEISQLNELQKELQKAVSTYPAVDKVLEEGSLYAVIYDNVWHRAQVIDSDEEIATVRFIDYGKTDVVNNKPDNVKVLPDSMKTKKIFGIKCRLDVIPVDSEDWNDEICKWMHGLKSHENLEASLIVDSDPKRIDLYIDGKSVIDTLVEEGKGVKVHYEEELVEEIVDVELDPRSAFISHINSLSDFYVQEEKSVSDLEKIQDRLLVANMFPKVSDVKEGTLCVAMYTDNDWYRARVIKQDESKIKVLFIDYGNNAEVTEIRAVPEDIASIPPLAKKCSLIKPYYASHWPEEAFDNFCELAAEGATIFLMDILKEGETTIIKLTLKNEDIAEKLASPVSVFVCNINSPTEFWVQKEESSAEVDKIQEKLVDAENYSQVAAKEGLLCVAKFPDDEQWYRSQIISHNENETQVLFIDYGNSSVCTEIRALPEDLAAVEPLAKKCSLKLPSPNDEWSQNAFDEFCNISEDGNVALFLDVIEDNETAIVNLFLGKENIAQKLISKTEVEENVVPEKLSTIEEDTREEEIVPVQEATPEKMVTSKVTPEVTSEVASEATSKQEEIAQIPVSVFISQLNSTQDFCVQNEDCAEKLEEIGEQLFAFENTPAVTEPIVGSIYSALYPCDDSWYRAKVISSSGNETNVFFIDYGNTSSVKELRVLSDELRDLPALAKKCSLKLPNDVSEWPEKCLGIFNDLSADGTCAFMLHVLEEGDTAIVDLKLNDESVTDKLLESVVKKLEKQNSELGQEKESVSETISAIGDEIVSENNEKMEETIEADKNSVEVEKTVEKDQEVVELDDEVVIIDEIAAKTDKQDADEKTIRVNEEGIKGDSILLLNIISPSEFWGQVGVDSDNIRGQLSQANEWTIIDKLEKGLMCAAKVNEEWHRARIESINDKEANAFLIDQGYTHLCKEFRQLPSDIVTKAPLAKKYSLQLPKNINKWTQAANAAFSKYSKTSFSMEILQIGDTPIIKLSHHDEDVAEILGTMRDDISSEITGRLPPEGDENSFLAISNIISPSMFWGQLESDSWKLEEMEKNLVDVASFNQLKNFDIGRICAAKFPDDEKWYRAKILSHSEESTEVVYVDFGNTSTTTELRILPHDLTASEYLSTQYSLRKPSDVDEWSEEACEKFIELAADGATYFEYKILDQEKKEIQLIYDGTDVVELLTPLCKKVEKVQEEEKTTGVEEGTKNIEVIDLAADNDPNTSLKDIIEEKNMTTSLDSAFHSGKVSDDSYLSHEMEGLSSTFQESDKSETDVEVTGNKVPELSVTDIIGKMTLETPEGTNFQESDKSDAVTEKLVPELSVSDIIAKMIHETADGTSFEISENDEKEFTNNETITTDPTESTKNSETISESRNLDTESIICEAEDNIKTTCQTSVTSDSTVSENQSNTEKSVEDSDKSKSVTIITSEDNSGALSEIEITGSNLERRRSSHDDKILSSSVSGDILLTQEEEITAGVPDAKAP